MAKLPAVIPARESINETLQKLQWHLAAANSLTEALRQQNYLYRIVSTTTGTGRVLLMLD